MKRFYQGKPCTPEKLVQNGVIHILKFHGWMIERNQQGLGHKKGRPDLEAYKKGIAIFIECKAPKGTLSDWQKEYIANLEQHGMKVFVVNDAEDFQGKLEALQEEKWPGQNIRRLF